jgi:hypothetical protein
LPLQRKGLPSTTIAACNIILWVSICHFVYVMLRAKKKILTKKDYKIRLRFFIFS